VTDHNIRDKSSNNKPKTIATGVTDFDFLIKSGGAYIDKTWYIRELLTCMSPMFLLTRPRRFGKTLLVDTIEQALLGNKKPFEGLYICSNEAQYDFLGSHVIRLNLYLPGRDASTFDALLKYNIQQIADRYGIKLPEVNSANSLNCLIEKLYYSYGSIHLPLEGEPAMPDMRKVAVLIDEYDSPITSNLHNPEKLEIARNVMFDLYVTLKTANEAKQLRFVLATGITKFKEFSDFSVNSILDDITYDPKYSAVCGFTLDEIRDSLKNEIEERLPLFVESDQIAPNSSTNDLLDLLTEWYDGYSWGNYPKVLNPYSVLKCLKNVSTGRHWYNTGSPSLLQNLLKQNDNYFSMFDKDITYQGSIPEQDISNISPHVALLQTGYLTIDLQAPPSNAESKSPDNVMYQFPKDGMTKPPDDVRVRGGKEVRLSIPNL
jgi:hypothetical protein